MRTKTRAVVVLVGATLLSGVAGYVLGPTCLVITLPASYAAGALAADLWDERE